MNRYLNSRTDSKIASIECSSMGNRQLSFIHLRDAAAMEQVKAWMLQSREATLLSETNNNNKPILVFSGTQSPTDILRTLREHGEDLQAPAPEKKKFNPWWWRATTSIAGQSLQITSSFTSIPADHDPSKPKPKLDWSVFLFATLNLAANFINYIYGAQEKEDPHHLHFLKEQFNTQLQPHLAANATLPSPDKNPLEEHGRAKNKELGFWDKYSVSLGEIGLRTLGSLALMFPVNRLGKEVVTEFKKTGSYGSAFKASLNPKPWSLLVGVMMVTGKIVSMFATEPDPYNPEAPSTFDKFRQKVAFKLSSTVEGLAAGIMTFDRMWHYNSTKGYKAIHENGTPRSIAKHGDLAGAAGNVLFVTGYGVRFVAPYGSREVNMRELYAHLSDGLAKVEPEKLPQLVLETAIGVHQHFKDKPANKKTPLDLPSIYARLVDELDTYHHIKLDKAPTSQTPSIIAEKKSPTPASSITGVKTHSHAAIANSVTPETHALAH
jgi:hypothetical protein